MKRLLIALWMPAILAGCVVEHRRPAVVEPHYVARCPEGYRYDGHDCHRVVAEPHGVEVHVR